MRFVRIPPVISACFRDVTWNIRGDKPAVYLTFDDGPTPDITQQVLSMLAKNKAQATFFNIGRNVERYPGIHNMVLQSGHAVGNHTYSHLKGWYTPNKTYYDDIALAGTLIHSGLFRPAYGMITPAQVNYLKKLYRIVLWDTMSYDFDANVSAGQCLRNVLQYARPGSVVVFHDSVKAAKNVLYALPRVLEHFGEKGWEFKSLENA